jgi:hypothetical protein
MTVKDTRRRQTRAQRARISRLASEGRLTPRDLRLPGSSSGYSYVTHDHGRRVNGHGGAGSAYQAFRPAALRKGVGKFGPRRATAVEAAQDYCDFVNGRGVESHTLRTAGHEYEVDETDRDPEYEAALGVIRDRTAQRKGRQGYVYIIVEAPAGRVDLSSGKVGYSTNPEKRVAELQTGNKRPLRLIYKKPGTEADERALHRKYIKNNEMQEWFRLTAGLLLEFENEHRVWTPEELAARGQREAKAA